MHKNLIEELVGESDTSLEGDDQCLINIDFNHSKNIDLENLSQEERIRVLMYLKGRTLEDYARALNKSNTSIRLVIKGYSTSKTIKNHIAADLGWPVEELFK